MFVEACADPVGGTSLGDRVKTYLIRWADDNGIVWCDELVAESAEAALEIAGPEWTVIAEMVSREPAMET